MPDCGQRVKPVFEAPLPRAGDEPVGRQLSMALPQPNIGFCIKFLGAVLAQLQLAKKHCLFENIVVYLLINAT